MKKDYRADVEAVMGFLYETFAQGNDKVSEHDVLENGRTLGDVVGELEEAIRSGDADDIDERVAAAILCMAELFGNGFELADEADETDAFLTLAQTADLFVNKLAPSL